MEADGIPGRSTPAAFRYQPEALARPARHSAATLYVVGGLYGNADALDAVLRRADREPATPATIVFNGDFHWLDVHLDDFRAIDRAVAAHHAVTGNVEAQLASPDDTGCGCAYPDYISDTVVDRSNRVMTRLRATAGRAPEAVRRLAGLPRHLTVVVGGERRLVINNGAAGLPNFRRTSFGVVTRLSTDPRPPADSLYGTTVGSVRCDALPVRFDAARWTRRFVEQWPRGSAGYLAYHQRITNGTTLRLEQAARGTVRLTASA